MKVLSCFFVLSSILWGRGSFAAFGNYNSILIGDQAAGMGGAATAVAEDTAGAPWYNPATLAAIPGERFSSAVGIYKKYETRFGESEDIVSSALRVNQGFFRALPSSTSSVIRPKGELFRHTTLAFSILVPEFDQYRGEVHRSASNSSSLTTTDESLWVGGSVAREWSENAWVGFSMYYAARSMNKTVSDRTYRNPTDFRIFSEDRALAQNAVVLILGYFRKFNESWAMGGSCRLSSLHVAGRGTYTANTFEAGQAEQPINLSSLDSRAHIPARLNLGISYRVTGRWLWASDLTIHFPTSYEDMQTDQTGIAENFEHRLTGNVSVGLEYLWNDQFKIRAGAFTNFSSYPEPDPGRQLSQGDRVDQLGFSANMALRSGAIEYTFGGYYSGGQGESVQRVDQAYETIQKTQNIFTMLVGTSYYF